MKDIKQKATIKMQKCNDRCSMLSTEKKEGFECTIAYKNFESRFQTMFFISILL